MSLHNFKRPTSVATTCFEMEVLPQLECQSEEINSMHKEITLEKFSFCVEKPQQTSKRPLGRKGH